MEVTVEVVLTLRPGVVPRTRTVMKQDWPPASVLDTLEKVPAGALMMVVPPPVAPVPHVPPVCVTRARPAGIVSLNATLVSGVALGLVTVMVASEVAPTKIVDGLKLLEIVAGTCARASPGKDAARSAATTSSAARSGAQVIARVIARAVAQAIMLLAAPNPRCDLIGFPRVPVSISTGGEPSPTMQLQDL